MPTMSEAEWMAILSPEAQEVYQGWRRVGYNPTRALNEVIAAGLYVDPAVKARYLRRPLDVFLRRLGAGATGPASACMRDLALAGRCLAHWQLLSAGEVDWLRDLAAGKAVSPDVSPTDAEEILAINDESAAELAAWHPAHLDRYPRLDEAGKGVTFWWRPMPLTFYTAQRR